jgi:hypothetical protein
MLVLLPPPEGKAHPEAGEPSPSEVGDGNLDVIV